MDDIQSRQAYSQNLCQAGNRVPALTLHPMELLQSSQTKWTDLHIYYKCVHIPI